MDKNKKPCWWEHAVRVEFLSSGLQSLFVFSWRSPHVYAAISLPLHTLGLHPAPRHAGHCSISQHFPISQMKWRAKPISPQGALRVKLSVFSSGPCERFTSWQTKQCLCRTACALSVKVWARVGGQNVLSILENKLLVNGTTRFFRWDFTHLRLGNQWTIGNWTALV